jgi:hypothetical protein
MVMVSYQIKVYQPPRTIPAETLDFCSPKHRREWERWSGRHDEMYLVCDFTTPITRECYWCGSDIRPE